MHAPSPDMTPAPTPPPRTGEGGADADIASGQWAGEAAARSGRGIDLLSLLPLVSIAALAACVAFAIAIVRHDEQQQRRNKLATDALWVEQTLRFQNTVDEDMLTRLALEAASGIDQDMLDTRTRLHMAANPELVAVVWYDAAGRRLRALPGAGAPADDSLPASLAGLDSPPARPVYGDLRPDGLVTMAMVLPGDRGFVAATLSLDLLLKRHIPWWIAEQYGVSILNSRSDVPLASRQQREPLEDAPAHTISFDPPFRGTLLRITAYERPSSRLLILSFAVIGGLALFSSLALVILYGSTKQRRRVERQLRNETAFRRSMEESLTVGMRAKDLNGRILYVNAAFCKLVGWSSQELVGRSAPMPYWDPSRLEETRARHELLAKGVTGQTFETRFVNRDGQTIDVQVYDAPLIDASGVHRGWMGSIIDITERNRATRQARQQDEAMAHTGRLVTLGEMASTLAHELNQPLSAIASYSAGMRNVMDREGLDMPLLRQANDKLAAQAGRAGQIIRRIQDLVKKRDPRFMPVSLAAVIHDTIGLLANDARAHNVRLVPRLRPVPMVQADSILLEQVLVNLIRNGIEAMAETRSSDIVEIRLDRDCDHAVVEVIDAGAGIAGDMADRLFEAFATSKASGMGMGLKICRSIIEMHKGRLGYCAAPQGGTVFCLSLPLSDRGAEEGPEAAGRNTDAGDDTDRR